jgi:glycine/D-amino acid oxidase-like deaminating enzyme
MGELAHVQDQTWDLLVIGGGITGAGVAQQAARRGWKVLLLEQRDFAWGTSSRSSKLVHGGLRYLKEGDLKTTLHSVQRAPAPDAGGARTGRAAELSVCRAARGESPRAGCSRRV